MDPNTVDLILLAMVEGHLAPVLKLTVLRQPYGPWPCNGDPNADRPRECSWFAPLPQVLKADATGVELLTWSHDPESEKPCEKAPLRCPLAQQTYVYSATSRRFEPHGEKVEAMKSLFRVHRPPAEQKPSPWTGRYAFTWHGGPGVAGGIVAVRSYDMVITGGEANLQVTLTESGTQTMGVSFDAHGVVTADGLAIALDQCHSEDEHLCSSAKSGDVVATLSKASRLRFGTLSSPDGTLEEIAGKKLP